MAVFIGVPFTAEEYVQAARLPYQKIEYSEPNPYEAQTVTLYRMCPVDCNLEEGCEECEPVDLEDYVSEELLEGLMIPKNHSSVLDVPTGTTLKSSGLPLTMDYIQELPQEWGLGHGAFFVGIRFPGRSRLNLAGLNKLIWEIGQQLHALGRIGNWRLVASRSPEMFSLEGTR